MTKQSRLEARVPPEVHSLLKRAAEIEGRTLTDFVVSAASAAARQTIEDVEIIRLTQEGQKAFLQALLDPPQPAPAMERAVKNRETFISPD